jgi:hypothetical protein
MIQETPAICLPVSDKQRAVTSHSDGHDLPVYAPSVGS